MDLRVRNLFGRSVLFLVVAIWAGAGASSGQSCTLLRGGCGEFPQQCFADLLAPAFWSDGITTQYRVAFDSPESTCHPPVTEGPPACCSSLHPPGFSQPTVSIRAVPTGDGAEVYVDYDAPNYFCQNTGDWPPLYTCVNDPLVSSDHLVLFLGTPSSPIDILARGFIYYEQGTWETHVKIPCGGAKTVFARIDYLTNSGVVSAVTDAVTLEGGECTDRQSCPLSGVGAPINVGSGDVSLTIPLLRLAQDPRSLAFSLSYHSERPVAPGLLSSPVGRGWTHSFAGTLRPLGPAATRLYQTSPEGYEYLYLRQTDGSWRASSPAELRARVDSSDGELVRTDLNGTVTAFDAASGLWLSTTDRWGNRIAGSYDAAGHLVTLADAEGRTLNLTYDGEHLARIELPGGATWSFDYDGDLLAAIHDPLHPGPTPWRSFEYQTDSEGVPRLLTAVRDESGALLEGHAYDALDRGTSSVSEGGRNRVSLEYDTPSPGKTRVISAIDGVTSQTSVFTLRYQHGRYLPTEILGNCPTCGGATSDDQRYTYTDSNRIASRVDALGHRTLFTYDANANLTSRTEAAGTPEERTTRFRYRYPPWPNFRTEVDEPSVAQPGARKITRFSWSADEMALTTEASGFLTASDAAPTTYTTVTTFDTRHRVVAVDGPRTDVADVTRQSYYSDDDPDLARRGRLATTTDAVGLVTSLDDYDDFGTARETTDPNGVLTRRETDPRGRVSSSTSQAVPGVSGEGSDYTTRFVFDGRDRLVRTVLPRANSIAYGYEDGTDRLVDTIRVDSAGRERERRHLTLNAIGNRVAEEDQLCDAPAAPCASWTTRRREGFAFDAHDRLAGVFHPVPTGSRTVNAYDADGLLATVRDENHASPNIRYTYDALHRLVRTEQTLSGAPGGVATTSYTYDAADNLTSVTDPNGNTTTYRYDDFRRLAREESPVSGVTEHAYDPAGNLVSTIDARGAISTRTYDPADRLLSATSLLAGRPTETVTHAYDDPTPGAFGLGRLASLTDPSGETTYAYERRGELTGEDRTILGTSYHTGYAYDANGNRSRIDYPSGRSVGYRFDFADRPLSVAAADVTYVAGASYLPFGPLERLEFGNDTSETRTFDLRYRPVENRLDGVGGPLADYLYVEDSLGNITQIRDALDPDFDRAFDYDDLNRLTSATTGAGLWGTGRYRYDPMGNLTELDLGAARKASFSYQGTLPELASVVADGVTQPIAYDAAGNEVRHGMTVSIYSARNLLSSADGLAYTYDGRGVRVATEVVSALGTATGLVTDLDGQPLPGATVRVAGGSQQATTDGSGRFQLLAPTGTYSLLASADGFLPADSLPFTLPAGAGFDVGTIALTPAPATVTGTVLGSLDGGPLPGAAVTAAETGATVFADASGRFALSAPAGTFTLTVAQAGYLPQTLAPVTVAAGRIEELGAVTLVVVPAQVSGQVLSSVDGTPVAGATVTAIPAPGAPTAAAAKGGQASLSATTDATGAFSLELAPGTYSFSITAAGFGTRTTGSTALGPGAVFEFGTLALEPLGTITGRVVAQATGLPVAGALVELLGTLNQAATDAVGAFTLTQGSGTYRLRARAAGFADLTTEEIVLQPGGSLDAGTLELTPIALSVFVAYADNLRASPDFPIPWQGAPDVVFLGGGTVFDAGAIRLDNSTGEPIAVDRVVVDLERPGPVFAPWGAFTVPAHGSVILTQTRSYDFDTSDFPIVSCGGMPAPGDPRVPKVSVTIGGATTDYFDTGHILDTGGSDLACLGNESLPWRLIGTTGVTAQGDFVLGPVNGEATTGEPYTLTALLSDAAGQPLPGVDITFRAVEGPDRGLTGSATTDETGRAAFSYTSGFAGTTTWQASFTNASGATKTSNQATVSWPGLAGLEVLVGYADNLRRDPAFPNPWAGSPGVLFLGGGRSLDAGAVRLDNTSDAPIAVDHVTVDLQRPGPKFSLWGSFTIPAHESAILTQTGSFDFDTSDFPIVGCGGTLPPDDPRIPKISVTVGGITQSFLDTAHILDTFGYDLACKGNESLQWRPVGSESTARTGAITLLPPATTLPVGGLAILTAAVTDAGGEPVTGVTVDFRVVSGPNTGATGSAVTDSSGLAEFGATSTVTGLDTLVARVTNASGGTLSSPTATILWLPAVHLVLSPPSSTQAVGSPYDATLQATDPSGQPVAGLAIRFRVTAGPNAGLSGFGTTDATGEAVFVYTSAEAGTDSLVAEVALAGGAVQASNQVGTTWTAPRSLVLVPVDQSHPVGSEAAFVATLSEGSDPVAGEAVSLAVTSGPEAGTALQGVTDTVGEAHFSLVGQAPGTDVLEARAGQGTGLLVSEPVSATWTAIPTAVLVTAPPVAEWNDPLTVTARLTVAASGEPITGQTLRVSLGTESAQATTGADGALTVTFLPRELPGTVTLSVAFDGAGPYLPSASSRLLAIARDETVLTLTDGSTGGSAGIGAIAAGTAQEVSARLTDGEDALPVAGKTVTFTVAGVSASGVTDAEGVARANLALPADALGPERLLAAFAGDETEQPAEASGLVIVYQPASFVLWGGNPGGLARGERIQFWGAQWARQVEGGDYHAAADFKGYASRAPSPAMPCEVERSTTSEPPLDRSCWSAQPGASGQPPETVGPYLGLLVATSIDQTGSTVFGNIAATVVVRVDTGFGYASDPGHGGFGTIVAVIEDPTGLVSDPSVLATGAVATGVTAGVTEVAESEAPAETASLAVRTSVSAPAITGGDHRNFLYTPELQLLAESELTTAPHPAVFSEYVWFGGMPVAQQDVSGETRWTFTDHLGTPLLQTSAQAGIVWRAEHEPYGRIFTLRAQDRHQPLRLLGQQAEQLNAGANGATDRSYNVYRWYDPGASRYTQPDPLGLRAGTDLFGFVAARPLNFADPLGLAKWNCKAIGFEVAVIAGVSLKWGTCESECNQDGYRWAVDYSWRRFGFGASVKGSLPVGASVFSFDDGWQYANPRNFSYSGDLCSTTYFSIALGAGFGAGTTRFGEPGGPPTPSEAEFGLGIGAFTGCGKFRISHPRKLCCNSDRTPIITSATPPPRPIPTIGPAP